MMDDAWNELSFDFEPAVQAALPASGVGNTRDRFRTQVCRHWLRGLCMMGDRCDFLHKMDRNRMPICRWRTDCQVEGCAFRHEEEQEAPECAMYQHGFCRHGPHCRFRHVKRAREECPEVADFSLSNPTTFPTNNGGSGGGPGSTRAASMGFSKNFGGAVYGSLVKAGTGIGARSGGGGAGREYAMEDVRKPSMCNHWRNGTDCPYGDRCMYAHGEDDPRKFSSRPPLPPVRFGFGGKDPFTDPEVEAAVPVKEGAPARFFVLRSLNHDNLAVSATQNKWYARRHSIMPFNVAFEKPGKVIFLFSVNYSNNFQGCAQMTARIPEMEVRTQEVTVMEFSIKWLRLCELPFGTANQIKNTLNEHLPVGRSRDGMEINYDSGRKLCKLMWAQSEVELPKQVVSHAKTVPFSGVEVYRLPPLQPMATAPKVPRGSGLGAGDEGSIGSGSGRNTLQLLGPSPLPPPPRALGGPPGFLFEIESQDFDECVGKLLFGLPRHLPPTAKQCIQPGNLMFLWDPGNALVLGIFRAVSGLVDMIDRTAWARPGIETHLPWQVKVSVDLRAPPIKAGDPILREVFRSGMVEPGALHPRQVDILASTMASRVQPPAAAGPGFNGPGMGVVGDPGMRGMGGNISRPVKQY